MRVCVRMFICRTKSQAKEQSPSLPPPTNQSQLTHFNLLNSNIQAQHSLVISSGRAREKNPRGCPNRRPPPIIHAKSHNEKSRHHPVLYTFAFSGVWIRRLVGQEYPICKLHTPSRSLSAVKFGKKRCRCQHGEVSFRTSPRARATTPGQNPKRVSSMTLLVQSYV